MRSDAGQTGLMSNDKVSFWPVSQCLTVGAAVMQTDPLSLSGGMAQLGVAGIR